MAVQSNFYLPKTPYQHLPFQEFPLKSDGKTHYHAWCDDEGYEKGKFEYGRGCSKIVYKAPAYPSNEIIAVAKGTISNSYQFGVFRKEIAMHKLLEGLDHALPLLRSFLYKSKSKQVNRVLLSYPFCVYTLADVPTTPLGKLKLLHQILLPLRVMHQWLWFHSDLKPQNIFIKVIRDAAGQPDFHAYLGDFGACCLEGKHVDTATWAYGSYEAIQDRYTRSEATTPVGRPSDVWSLGVIAHECWTGHILTSQGNAASVIYANHALAKGTPDFVEDQRKLAVDAMPNMVEEFKNLLDSSKLSQLVKSCLVLDPSKRLTLEEFSQRLGYIIKKMSPPKAVADQPNYYLPDYLPRTLPLKELSLETDGEESYRTWGDEPSWDPNKGYYKGKEECGQGGSKTVYKAYAYPSKKMIAVAKATMNKYTDLLKLINELQANAVLKGVKHFLPLEQHFIYRSRSKQINRVLLTFPYCEFTLDNIPATPLVKLKLLAQACTALECFHRYGYLHGDIKGANILAKRITNSRGEADFHAYLTDFGGSKKADVPTEYFTTSWEYGSLEALQQVFLKYDPARKPLGKPSDIWSLGLVADECMTNTLLTYRGSKAGKVFFDCIVAKGDPAFVSKQFELAVATVPAMIAESKELLGDDKLSRLVKNCLDLDPAKRVNIDVFMRELNDYIKELSVATTP